MGKNTGIWQNERWKTTVFQNAGIDTLSRLDCRNRFRSSHVSKQRLQPLIHPNLVQVLFKSFRILFFNSSISIVQSLYFVLEVVSLLLDRSLSYMFLIFYRPELWLHRASAKERKSRARSRCFLSREIILLLQYSKGKDWLLSFVPNAMTIFLSSVLISFTFPMKKPCSKRALNLSEKMSPCQIENLKIK